MSTRTAMVPMTSSTAPSHQTFEGGDGERLAEYQARGRFARFLDDERGPKVGGDRFLELNMPQSRAHGHWAAIWKIGQLGQRRAVDHAVNVIRRCRKNAPFVALKGPSARLTAARFVGAVAGLRNVASLVSECPARVSGERVSDVIFCATR